MAGSHSIVVYATFTKGDDVIQYGQEYWDETGSMRVTISESKLEMPNAFSPNGDGINDIYKAKDGYQSIVEFHAYIFNRWGQKLFEWTNPADGWDGKYKGKDVARNLQPMGEPPNEKRRREDKRMGCKSAQPEEYRCGNTARQPYCNNRT